MVTRKPSMERPFRNREGTAIRNFRPKFPDPSLLLDYFFSSFTLLHYRVPFLEFLESTRPKPPPTLCVSFLGRNWGMSAPSFLGATCIFSEARNSGKWAAAVFRRPGRDGCARLRQPALLLASFAGSRHRTQDDTGKAHNAIQIETERAVCTENRTEAFACSPSRLS